MTQRDAKPYLEPYRQAVAQFGPGFPATLWASREAQQLRFDVMIEMADATGGAGGFTDAVIVDAGCGSGDFAARMLERGVRFRRYVGLDALPQLIEEARRRNLPRCEFKVQDVLDGAALALEGPDFVCFSGTLNTMDEATAQGLVRSAFEASARGVLFNFLSTRHHPRWTGRDIGPARRFDPINWINLALALSSGVSFRQDYMEGHDATILIRREAADGMSK